ncbi:MAG: DUF4340 domain-containing protein [Acidobacteria bacterium]|nr:DUF4340 domain-containing protein [Acidobacteriota bacterium]
MSELTKTLLFCVGAAVLTAAAVVVDPGSSTPEIFSDQGELFFPNFTDPNAPKAIEVIDYDPETATATPLKVELKDNRWVLPSHNNYPADASERLASTAAALTELHKDVVVSDRVEDHAQYGVVDPLDENNASLEGRGKRVTLRDEKGDALADFVIGKPVEGKQGFRYMRVPGQRRVYEVKTDVDPSAEFRDWIETDLLKLASGDIRRVEINNYQITEQFGMPVMRPREQLTLTKNEKGDWSLGGRKPKESAVSALNGALDSLKIVDIVHKPEFLTAELKTKGRIEPSMAAARELVQRGFYLSGDGKIYGNEGEEIVDAANGIRYTLHFGEIASSATARKDPAAEQGESRYLLIAVSKTKALDEKTQALYDELRDRFADWYYVISGADFAALRPERKDLL